MGENKQKNGRFSSDRSFKRYEQLKQKGCFGPGGWNNGRNLNRFFLSDSTSKNTRRHQISTYAHAFGAKTRHLQNKVLGSCEIVGVIPILFSLLFLDVFFDEKNDKKNREKFWPPELEISPFFLIFTF